MNTPKTLYNTLNALIFLVILAIGVGVVFTALAIYGVSVGKQQSGTDLSLADLTTAHYIFMGLNLIIYFVFIYGLFKLRKVAKLFLYESFYNTGLVINSALSGKSFVLAGVFWWLFDGLSSVHFDQQFSIGVGEKTFVYLFIIVVGLFLMLTSKLYEQAIELKNENDLTI